MKYLFLFMVSSSMLVGFSSKAFGAEPPFVCVVGTSMSENEELEPYFEEVRYTCEQLERVGNGVEVAKITVQAGALISACTGAGTPVAVTLQGVVIGLSVVKLVVGNLPCDDMREKKIEANVKQMVCDEMIRQGVKCNRSL